MCRISSLGIDLCQNCVHFLLLLHNLSAPTAGGFYSEAGAEYVIQIFNGTTCCPAGAEARGGADGEDGEDHRRLHAASDEAGGRHRRTGLLRAGQSPADAGHGERKRYTRTSRTFKQLES